VRRDTAIVLGDYRTDTRACSDYWQLLDEQLARLPPKASRNANEVAAATRVLSSARLTREAFLKTHVDAVYDSLTDGASRFVPVKELVLAAARLVPGLVPTAEQLAVEDDLPQSEKEGREVDQGLFLAHVLGSERAGRHLCHAMLLPRPETAELLPKLARDGRIDLGAASVELRGKAAILTLSNPRYLNAEDQPRSRRRRSPSTSPPSTPPPRSPYCGAGRSSIRNTKAAASLAAAST
jgi:thioesterase DpgC